MNLGDRRLDLIEIDRYGAIEKLAELERFDDLWYSGHLYWKLKGKQKDIYKHFADNEKDIIPCLISRRFGKTFTMCILAVEVCLKTPNAVVKYVCPTSKMVVNVMYPTVREIIEDCPDDIKPTWYPSEKKWKFPNGSEIQVAGTEGGAYDAIRGGYSHLAICDEAAFQTDLETVVFNVLAPTTDTTEGKIYLASTPNDKDPSHDFHEFFVTPYETTGDLLRMTWEDSPMIDDARREKILSRYPGGLDNVKFRCEYLCEIPNVVESSVVPEFAKNEEKVIKEVELPDHCDFYTAMDLGFKDLTVALFGYYDFNKSTLVVLDEYVINGEEMKTDIIDKNIRMKEEIHFRTKLGKQEAYLRVMDNNNLLLINDLVRNYDLMFQPTQKHGKEQAVDTVRRWVEQGRIIIHPRCKNLIYHTKNAQWGVTRAGTRTGKFKHLKGNDSVGLLTSHADALDALIYMVRNIHTHRNPYPSNYGMNINENTHIPREHLNNMASEGADFMGKLLNLRKKSKNRRK